MLFRICGRFSREIRRSSGDKPDLEIFPNVRLVKAAVSSSSQLQIQFPRRVIASQRTARPAGPETASPSPQSPAAPFLADRIAGGCLGFCFLELAFFLSQEALVAAVGERNRQRKMAQEEAHAQPGEPSVGLAPRTPLNVAELDCGGRPARHPLDRPVVKLSLRLIDTYKNVNKVGACAERGCAAECAWTRGAASGDLGTTRDQLYYERKARRQRKQSRTEPSRGGVHNNGYDDQNYDYIIQPGEVFADRYVLKNRIGKVQKSGFFVEKWRSRGVWRLTPSALWWKYRARLARSSWRTIGSPTRKWR